MAVSDAMRRTGSLLLRTLAVGGLATTAWLLGTGAAAADSQDHSNEVSTPLDVVNTALDQQHTATTALLDSILTDQLAPSVPAPATYTAHLASSVPLVPMVQPSTPVTAEAVQVTAPLYGAGVEEEPTSFSGGTEGRPDSRTGTITNTLPAPQYEAKVAAKAAIRQAAQQEQEQAAAPVDAPQPLPVEMPVHQAAVVPPQPAPQAAEATAHDEPTATHVVTWENPAQAPAAPAPSQAPAPTAPTTASSSGHDSSNGHRGGVIASATGRSGLVHPAEWSVEQREDDRSPGSVQGLPSTSPD